MYSTFLLWVHKGKVLLHPYDQVNVLSDSVKPNELFLEHEEAQWPFVRKSNTESNYCQEAEGHRATVPHLCRFHLLPLDPDESSLMTNSRLHKATEYLGTSKAERQTPVYSAARVE